VTRFTTGAKLNLISPGDDGTRASCAGAVTTSADHTAKHPIKRRIMVMRIPLGGLPQASMRAILKPKSGGN
jgi:hypothetical protein